MNMDTQEYCLRRIKNEYWVMKITNNIYLVRLQQVNITIVLSFSCLTWPAGRAKTYLKGCVNAGK